MRIDWDVPIRMDDGLVLRADVYRPEKEGRFPVILSYGPYAKGLAFRTATRARAAHGRRAPRRRLRVDQQIPEWEVVDPEKWVRTDMPACASIPAARTLAGHIDHFSPRETKDFYLCIEWAGVQPGRAAKSA